jgi:RNA polymerase sigma-70 factor (ECF subfamily)
MARVASFFSTLLAPSDEQLMWRVQSAGDHRAFAALMDRWERPIWRLCARMTGDAHRAEDLKQEAFTRLFERRADYRMGTKVSTWLWRIATNLCLDELRRVNRRGESSIDADAPGDDEAEWSSATTGPDADAATREEGELVRQALLRLPEDYRAVLVLRHYEGLKLRQIAEVLDVPEGTVNSRMAEALARLARLLTPLLAEPKPTSSPRRASVESARAELCVNGPGCSRPLEPTF